MTIVTIEDKQRSKKLIDPNIEKILDEYNNSDIHPLTFACELTAIVTRVASYVVMSDKVPKDKTQELIHSIVDEQINLMSELVEQQSELFEVLQ